MLRKNALLQTRSGRSFLGISGMAALVLETLTPAAFFLLMCLPKYYFDVKPTPIPTQLFQSMDLDNPHWANKYQGEGRSALIPDIYLVLNLHRNMSLLAKRCFLALILKVTVSWLHALRRARSHTCHACHCLLPACACMACEIESKRHCHACRASGSARLQGNSALCSKRQQHCRLCRGLCTCAGLPGRSQQKGAAFGQLLLPLQAHDVRCAVRRAGGLHAATCVLAASCERARCSPQRLQDTGAWTSSSQCKKPSPIHFILNTCGLLQSLSCHVASTGSQVLMGSCKVWSFHLRWLSCQPSDRGKTTMRSAGCQHLLGESCVAHEYLCGLNTFTACSAWRRRRPSRRRASTRCQWMQSSYLTALTPTRLTIPYVAITQTCHRPGSCTMSLICCQTRSSSCTGYSPTSSRH